MCLLLVVLDQSEESVELHHVSVQSDPAKGHGGDPRGPRQLLRRQAAGGSPVTWQVAGAPPSRLEYRKGAHPPLHGNLRVHPRPDGLPTDWRNQR